MAVTSATEGIQPYRWKDGGQASALAETLLASKLEKVSGGTALTLREDCRWLDDAVERGRSPSAILVSLTGVHAKPADAMDDVVGTAAFDLIAQNAAARRLEKRFDPARARQEALAASVLGHGAGRPGSDREIALLDEIFDVLENTSGTPLGQSVLCYPIRMADILAEESGPSGGPARRAPQQDLTAFGDRLTRDELVYGGGIGDEPEPAENALDMNRLASSPSRQEWGIAARFHPSRYHPRYVPLDREVLPFVKTTDFSDERPRPNSPDRKSDASSVFSVSSTSSTSSTSSARDAVFKRSESQILHRAIQKQMDGVTKLHTLETWIDTCDAGGELQEMESAEHAVLALELNDLASLVLKNQPPRTRRYREDAVKSLFAQISPRRSDEIGKQYGASADAYAKYVIGNFAAVFQAACDKIGADPKLSVFQKNRQLNGYKKVAKEYGVLIQNGLIKGHAFSARGGRSAAFAKQLRAVEDKLFKLSGAATPAGRPALQNAMFGKAVQSLSRAAAGPANRNPRSEKLEISRDMQGVLADKFTDSVFSAVDAHAAAHRTSLAHVAADFGLIGLLAESLSRAGRAIGPKTTVAPAPGIWPAPGKMPAKTQTTSSVKAMTTARRAMPAKTMTPAIPFKKPALNRSGAAVRVVPETLSKPLHGTKRPDIGVTSAPRSPLQSVRPKTR